MCGFISCKSCVWLCIIERACAGQRFYIFMKILKNVETCFKIEGNLILKVSMCILRDLEFNFGNLTNRVAQNMMPGGNFFKKIGHIEDFA